MLQLLLVLTFLLEGLLYTKLFWRIRLAFVILLTSFVPGLSVLTFVPEPSWLMALVAVIGVSRVVNYLRIAKARMNPDYMLHVTRQTGLLFIAVQAVTLLLSRYDWAINLFQPLPLAIAQVLTSLVILFSAFRTLRRARYTHDSSYLADRDLPTVTVAIPARNETDDLQACLTTVLASNYPKLEVIVLDDCSLPGTSEIIKSFAHDGVRFVKGAEPDERWLAKNQAYARLADESSGQLILFCGVDVRFGPNAIRALVTSLSLRKKKMISILPRRLDGSIAGAFLQSMRYWWEIATPRRAFNRPPALGTAWLIERKTLEDLGGMAAVSHQIIPEAYFARELAKRDDSYSFMRASNDLDIQTAKSAAEQWITAVRVCYPQIHRRPEMALLLTIFDIVILLGAVPVIIWGLMTGAVVAAGLAAVSTILLVITHLAILQATNPGSTWSALFSFPIAVIVEILAGNISMLRYEFGSVIWKERNVSFPVMHAYPHLPKR